jgi:hypothetical protein
VSRNDGDDVDQWDALDGIGPAYGRALVERLLLSLIDAHPKTETRDKTERYFSNREKRLRMAMKALFNEKPSQKLLDDAASFGWPRSTSEIARDDFQKNGKQRPTAFLCRLDQHRRCDPSGSLPTKPPRSSTQP